MIDVKKIIDISWPISESMTAYKDSKVTTFSPVSTFEHQGSRKTKITVTTHDGTHIDAPSHFLEHGKTIDQLPLNLFIGPCKVFDLTTVDDQISAERLEGLDIWADDAVLFKTKNSFNDPSASFMKEFVYIDHSGARFLAERKIRTIGFDYLGIERQQPGHETHNLLLSNNIGIVEGLRLAHVAPGSYFFCCLPLNLQGLDGAPARAVLFPIK